MSDNPHRLFTPAGGDAEPIFQIGLRPIPIERWFEGGEADPAARKDAVMAQAPALAWKETAGSRDGQAEVLAMVCGWLGDDRPEGDAPPLLAAARLVSDDLCLMEKRGGAWTLTAASLCAPSFFSAKDAVGLPLDGLHAPVPGFNADFLPRVTRMFDAIQPEVIVERRNWSLVNSAELFLPSAEPLRASLPQQSPAEIAAALHVRRERQTIRRLPLTGGALFTIRIWVEPLAELLAEPMRRTALAAAWERVMDSEGADFRDYKRLDLYDAAMRSLLTGG